LFPFFFFVAGPYPSSTLLDFVSAPTPFVIGVPAALRDELPPLDELVVIDLDADTVTLPAGLDLPPLPAREHAELLVALHQLCRPHVACGARRAGHSPGG
jgi:hypothetical protein